MVWQFSPHLKYLWRSRTSSFSPYYPSKTICPHHRFYMHVRARNTKPTKLLFSQEVTFPKKDRCWFSLFFGCEPLIYTTVCIWPKSEKILIFTMQSLKYFGVFIIYIFRDRKTLLKNSFLHIKINCLCKYINFFSLTLLYTISVRMHRLKRKVNTFKNICN